jgi:hypothetical protein
MDVVCNLHGRRFLVEGLDIAANEIAQQPV